MNTFFSNMAIRHSASYHDCESISRNISDAFLKAIVKFRNHLSIKTILRESLIQIACFLLILIVDRDKILIEISNLDVKNQMHIFISCLMFQSMMEPFHQFSNWLMLPQFFKKGSKNSNNNCRPIRILEKLSKVFQNIYKKVATFMDKYL